jgi:hypothetical protein
VRPLPIAGEIPLYVGDLEADVRRMNRKTAEQFGGRLSFPSKMDVASWGIPATRCRIGSALAQVEGSVCESCYALKGSFTFPSVRNILEENYQKLRNYLWTPAMAAQIRWLGQERFRWFVSGDLAGINHLRNIIRVCLATPEVCHWLPTREAAVLRSCEKEIPPNLTPRLSSAMIDGPAPRDWKWTSTVVTVAGAGVCPSSVKGGSCADNECVRCWRDEGNVAYLKH